jgi:cardiolipin synthase
MNIPNLLSFFRILLVPLFAGVFFRGGAYGQLYATGIFLLAGITDVIDGHLARKMGQVTTLGRVLDPAADKLMVLVALVCCVVAGYIPLWAVIAYAVKECVQGVLGLLLLRKVRDVPPANRLGKAGTVLFYVTIAGSIILEVPPAVRYVMLIVSFACIYTAMATYVAKGLQAARQSDHPKP